MCSPTCGLERPLRLIRLILSLDHRRTSHWLDWQSLAAAAAVVAAAVVLCYNVLWETLCAAPKVQILWEGHKIWKTNPTFFWNNIIFKVKTKWETFQIFVAFWNCFIFYAYLSVHPFSDPYIFVMTNQGLLNFDRGQSDHPVIIQKLLFRLQKYRFWGWKKIEKKLGKSIYSCITIFIWYPQDPTTNSETMNLNFYKYFEYPDQVCFPIFSG